MYVATCGCSLCVLPCYIGWRDIEILYIWYILYITITSDNFFYHTAHCVLRMSIKISLNLRNPGPLFTKKTPSYGYRDPHYKSKTVWWPSQVYNRNPYTDKTASSVFTQGNPFAYPGINITHPFCYLRGKCSFRLIWPIFMYWRAFAVGSRHISVRFYVCETTRSVSVALR